MVSMQRSAVAATSSRGAFTNTPTISARLRSSVPISSASSTRQRAGCPARR